MSELPSDPDSSDPPEPRTAPIATPAPDDTEAASPAHRIAGALLIANGLLVLLGHGVLLALRRDITLPGLGIATSVLDLIVGFSLLLGSSRLHWLALARGVFGLLVLTTLYATMGDPLAASALGLASATFLALLLGEAGKARIAAASAGFGLYILLGCVQLAMAIGGGKPFNHVVLEASGEIEGTAVSVLQGNAEAYRLRLPEGQWYPRNPELAKKDNALADRWLIWPERNSHMVVIAERLADVEEIDVDALTDVVLENAKAASTDVTVVERKALERFPDEGRLLHTTSRMGALKLGYLYGIFARRNRAFQVVMFTEQSGFESAEPELRRIIESFEFPPDLLPVQAAPADGDAPAEAPTAEGAAPNAQAPTP